jgi:hypothetical protein
MSKNVAVVRADLQLAANLPGKCAEYRFLQSDRADLRPHVHAAEENADHGECIPDSHLIQNT